MIARFLRCASLLVVALWSVGTPMGDQTTPSTLKEPAFAPLEDGEDVLSGRIKDESTTTELTQLSFFGHSAVGGIRREDDDSTTKLDLGKIKSLKVVEHTYASKRYPEKDFALIKKTSLDGTVTEGLLLPRHIIICGVEKKTGDEKSWYLNKIDELIIDNAGVETEVGPSPETIEKVLNKADGEMPAPTARPRQGQKIQKIIEEPIKMTEEYKEKELKVVDKKDTVVATQKTIMQALTDVVFSIVGLIRTILNFVKSIFW